MLNKIMGTAVLASAAVAVGIMGFIPKASSASNYSFTCKSNHRGIPTTYANLPDGSERAFINWTSNRMPIDPQDRCEQVTNRMNDIVTSGENFYMTHGVWKGNDGRFHPVLCTAPRKGEGCNRLVYTLKPGQDAEATLRDFLDLNRRNFKNDPIRESSCRTYVDSDAFFAGQMEIAEVVCTPES